MTKALKMLRRILRKGFGISHDFAVIEKEIHEAKILSARVLMNQMKAHDFNGDIQNAEFKVFSQFGDDGIIQYLVEHLKIEPETFIEFGVHDYVESNTRFLLINNRWKGLVIDGGKENVDFIRNDRIYWEYDLTAVCAFIDKENINRIFLENNVSGNIGVLSIDLDGNDYWIWEAIDVVDPVLVIVEYNSKFGDAHAIVVPYDPNFVRSQAHYSCLYWGASLKALCFLAEKKGYAFIGSNRAGNNAYFVKKNNMGDLRQLSSQEGYVESQFRESRDQRGQLTHVSGIEAMEMIKDMPVYEVERGITLEIGQLFWEQLAGVKK